MWGVSLDRFAYGARDAQDRFPERCDTCGKEMYGGDFFEDVCDSCAVVEGWLEVDEG